MLTVSFETNSKSTDDIIVRVAGVSLDFVQKVRADLARDKK